MTTCGIFSIFDSDEYVQVRGLSECEFFIYYNGRLHFKCEMLTVKNEPSKSVLITIFSYNGNIGTLYVCVNVIFLFLQCYISSTQMASTVLFQLSSQSFQPETHQINPRFFFYFKAISQCLYIRLIYVIYQRIYYVHKHIYTSQYISKSVSKCSVCV